MSKFTRWLTREHFYKTKTVSIAGPIATTICGMFLTGATGGFGLPVAILALGGGSALGLGIGFLFGGIEDSVYGVDDNRMNGPGYTQIIGSRSDLVKIKKMEKFIERMTDKYKHLPILPPNVQNTINLHLQDIQDAVRRTKMYRYDTLVDSLSFSRDYYDQHGRSSHEVIGTIMVSPQAEIEQPRAPLVLPAPKTKADEVNELTQKFTEIAKQLQDLEKLPEAFQQMEKKLADMQTVQTGSGLVVKKDRIQTNQQKNS